MLTAEGVTVRYGEKTVLDGVDLTVRPGEWWMVLGPNGAGKSTLISAFSRTIPYTGRVAVLGRDARICKSGEWAQMVGVLEQHHAAGYGFTVEEVVSLGRYAYRKGFLRGADAQGKEKIREALEMTGLTDLRGRSVLTLSGGERQRVFLAQALAQDPAVLMLDEPANHLDLVFQRQLFSLIGDWLREPGRAVISVVHDLLLARHWGSHALLLTGGKTVAAGKIGEVLTRENLEKVYGMDVHRWMRDMLAEWTAT